MRHSTTSVVWARAQVASEHWSGGGSVIGTALGLGSIRRDRRGRRRQPHRRVRIVLQSSGCRSGQLNRRILSTAVILIIIVIIIIIIAIIIMMRSLERLQTGHRCRTSVSGRSPRRHQRESRRRRKHALQRGRGGGGSRLRATHGLDHCRHVGARNRVKCSGGQFAVARMRGVACRARRRVCAICGGVGRRVLLMLMLMIRWFLLMLCCVVSLFSCAAICCGSTSRSFRRSLRSNVNL
jgi:uncharacterized membrane protein